MSGTGRKSAVPPVPPGKRVTLVAALARNRAIGKDGGMPWHLPGELKHFKATTLGKPVVMGRRTFESIGRALPGRQNIVVTRNPDFRADGCDIASTLAGALALARGEEVMIIGGGQLYREALPLASRTVLTFVDCMPSADTWFPEWDDEVWVAGDPAHYPPDERNAMGFDIVEYRRLNGG